jgi:DNA-directed RNA polymerase specialized sigma24 family protein
MTDSHRVNSKNRQTVGREALARFLESLSPNVKEADLRYIRLHERLVRFFRLKGIPDPESAADETIDRAALKIISGTPVPDADKYCLGIARNLTKERYRRAQRENSVFLKFIENLPDAANEQVERIYRILKPCFEQLTSEEQELLEAYCQVIEGRARAEHRRHLAEIMKTTVLALRMRVTRLRSILTDCVKKHSIDG